ncbi:Golgi membrane protein 1 [Leptonychotes weddellii]|uniref:Golgi membrane protein 1 n=1 Tax=Leptonychotes weddellii TaxID=9713 RepID=A0A7F8QX85_LEPWE|nr:Golgi membrane protein 1 [Leptonychotes weddellii]
MMGLGNGRRSMKSPPLVLAALVACIIVLGFNYWIASSRSVDLQTRILELEGRVRRAAAERGAVELKKNEFQGELEKQREQLDRIQSSHDSQLESVNKIYQDEKARPALLPPPPLNSCSIEVSLVWFIIQVILVLVDQTIRNLLVNPLRKSPGCCVILFQLRAPSEPQPRPQEVDLPQAEVPQVKGNMPSNGDPQTPVPSSEAALDLKGQGGKKESNEIQVASEELPRDSLGLPRQPGQEQAVEEGRPVGGRGIGEAEAVGRTPQVPGVMPASQENQDTEDLERDQLVIPGGQEEEQDADEEGRHQQKLAGEEDYNMDENEAESETDKQAALAGNDRNLNVLNAGNQKGDVNLLDQREKRNHTV